MSKSPLTVFWFRRDLRIEDNAGLYYALKENHNVIPLFIFDTDIIDKLPSKQDPRVEFIHQEIASIKHQLEKIESSLWVKHGKPLEIFQDIIGNHTIKAVYANHDYEPYSLNRDEQINKLLTANHISFKTFKDQVIFEKSEVTKKDGKPYTVFTPFSRAWMKAFDQIQIPEYDTGELKKSFLQTKPLPEISLADMGFTQTEISFPQKAIDSDILENYHNRRDYPAKNSTSRLGMHLRFGTISIRKLAQKAAKASQTYLNELIWREFYMMILWNFPHVVDHAFKPAYDFIEWRNDESEFRAWCKGKTGYPIVDAGMRELNTTGFMHNRVRMIAASFLTKHLLVDWRWGEQYFGNKLLDYELSSNNGGWQWAAGSGCDATPYFRVFNPELQIKKFDVNLKYIRSWIPEFEDFGYPKPLVEHKYARQRALDTYKKALDKTKK